ncbi:hypothetical protein ACI2KE_06940 [Pseudomonas monteilii]|jgi:hypothetical protein|uniref:hypothetical protein n=1 Tax=Pseudomonas alabamensis TaxID=3064349 RepID=UPI000745D8CC|nr:hypothetical protein [Pseudomonas entomophila]AMA47008.1 hypothetical protein APT63_16045 [Pseudomonas monteilii]
MYRRLLLIAWLGLLTTACTPYVGSYSTQYYTTDRPVYPTYYQVDRYQVVTPPGYYAVPPRPYHRHARPPRFVPYPPPGLNPHWQGGDVQDRRFIGQRHRYDYGRDRDRRVYDRRYQEQRRAFDQRGVPGAHPRGWGPRGWQR